MIQIFNSKSNRKLISRIFIVADANTSWLQYRHVNHETLTWQSNVFFHFLKVSPRIYNPPSECNLKTKTYILFVEDLLFSYVFICVGLRCVRARCALVSAGTQGVRKGHLIPWIGITVNCESPKLGCWGPNSDFSGRIVHAFNHWVKSQALHLPVLYICVAICRLDAYM